jgi:melanoma-associated antigen
VLGPTSSRDAFKSVFADAQKTLRQTFGMELSELPLKDKVTVAQKRAAHTQTNAQSNTAPVTSKTYILTSTLPPALRSPAILPPPRIPDVQTEAAFEGFVGFVVGVIYLSEGQRISEGKLLRYLRTCNADDLVLGAEKTENVLKRLERQGYLVKIKERDGAGGEENIEYVVGPRGKLEIGPQGVAGLVRSVYGKRDTELEELEDRLEASLGKGTFRRKTANQDDAQEDAEADAGEGPSGAGGESRPRRNGRQREEATYGRRQTRSSRNVAEEEEDDEDEDD